jgi:hypothetical protein
MKKMLAIAALALFLAAHVAVTAMTLYPGSAMADCSGAC